MPSVTKESFFKNEVVAVLITWALFFSGILVVFTPLPFIYLSLKKQRIDFTKPALISLAIVVLVYLFAFDALATFYQNHPNLVWLFPVPHVGLAEYFSKPFLVAVLGIGYFCFYLALSFFISKLILNPAGLVKKITYPILGIFLTAIFLTILAASPDLQSEAQGLKKILTVWYQGVYTAMSDAGADNVRLIEFKESLALRVRMMSQALLSLCFSGMFTLYLLNLVVAKRMFRPIFPKLNDIKLTNIQLPFFLVWIILSLIALFLINYQFLGSTFLNAFCLNFLIVFLMIYFFQGLAVLIVFLDRKNVRGFFRIFVYFTLIFFIEYLGLALALWGLFEHWIDVRKLGAQTTT